ncbi:protoglobin domain-containing protein [Bacillus massiliigorillae]|uniref:protoglobin domain-containing protein n=1 Tax=Bacillus massiliigorillae TaxID=1243664 RepID=UPI0003A63414|nr:globin-coupled sensor protein [Bacillus massiliigorillae]
MIKGSEFEKQLQMIDFSLEDLVLIRRLQPLVNQKIDIIIARFYQNLEKQPLLYQIINDHSSLAKLKNTLKRHITEIFNGIIDNDYITKRIQIAHIHVKIGLPTKWYMCAFQDLFLSLITIIENNSANKEECVRTLSAVSKILNLEHQLVVEAYNQEAERIKMKIEEQKHNIREQVASASENLAAISEQTSASFNQLHLQSTELVSSANSGAELSLFAEKRALQGKEQIQEQTMSMDNINDSVNDISTNETPF